MNPPRTIYFQNGFSHLQIPFGTYALLLYYATELNFDKGKLFLDATLTEYNYCVSYNYSTNGIDDEDSSTHFNFNDLQEVVNFLQNFLIPILNNENEDLISKYGGSDSFYNLYNSTTDFRSVLTIYEDEEYISDPKQLLLILNILIAIFDSSISANTPSEIWIQ